jgi:hypothetical protein
MFKAVADASISFLKTSGSGVWQLPPMWLVQNAFSKDIAHTGRCLATPRFFSHRNELVDFPPLVPATLEGEPPRHRGLDGLVADR